MVIEYNKTQLSPDKEFSRHIFHRDQFAHYLRWTHVLKLAKIGMNILDLGCGTGNLAEVLYRNKYKANHYLGVDIRNKTIESNREKFKTVPWANFQCLDLVKEKPLKLNWDIIACFELLEHIGKDNAHKMLSNIKHAMGSKTILLLSTPCFDDTVGAAKNHIINNKICEFTYNEMHKLLSEYFMIENVFGTFASQKDYKEFMNDWQKQYYDAVKEYFDSNILSNLMAPLFPRLSRNCLWRCILK